MPESFKSKITRWGFNWFPAYRGAGGKLLYVADDWHEVRVMVRRNWRTRNYMGTIYGGSMYGAVDPIYMIMLIKILGPEYIVWDKSASIRFRRPGRTPLYATFKLDEAEINATRETADRDGKTDRVYSIDLVDTEGEVHAVVEKTIHVKRKK